MKILICNGHYIGDLIVATSPLPVLKSAFPDAEIGFLTASWAKEVVRDHSLVDRIHLYDHPRISREALSLSAKREKGKNDFRCALKEINEVGYDLALHFPFYFAGDLLYFSNIKERVAHMVAKAPYFYNHHLFWPLHTFSLVEHHGKMLEAFGIEQSHLKKLKVTLEYRTKIESLPKMPSKYILVHMGSGDFTREWPESSWIRLFQLLSSHHLPLVFIGKGERERGRIARVREKFPDSIDLSNQLSFHALIEVVKRASCVIGLESMVGHVTAAFDVPGVFIYTGFASIELWRPYSNSCAVVAPKGCDFAKGGTPSDLVKTISAEEVYESVSKRVLLFK